MVKLAHKRIAFTGRLEDMPRKQAQLFATHMGADVRNTVTPDLELLVVGSRPGPKLAQAQKQRTKILDEKAWMKTVNASAEARDEVARILSKGSECSLKVYGNLVVERTGSLDEQEAKSILEDGIYSHAFNDLLDDGESGPLDCQVYCDSVKVAEWRADDFKAPRQEKKLSGYFAMELSIEKGLLGKLAIQSPFDPDKLKCALSYPGGPYSPHLVITYDGAPIDENFDYRNKAQEMYLLSPDSMALDVRWLDEEDMEEE